MSGTYAVVTVHQGRESLMAGHSLAEAEGLAADLPELLGITGTVRDLMPDLEARFPVGAAVWLSQRIWWRPGQPGTVTAGEPDEFARWPLGKLSPWFIGTDGAYVHVALDDGYESWWRSTWLETRLPCRPASGSPGW